MRKNLGIPYMGSKRKLSYEIVSYILRKNPNCKYFYDLFGGGGAISFQALQYKNIQQVYYNEIDTGVCELLRKIQKEGVTSEFYKWVDRETFHANKEGKDWYAGLVKMIWSFGNKGDSYLFGKEIENIKRLMHEVVVNKCEISLKELSEIGFDIPETILKIDSIRKSRLFLKNVILDRINLQQFESLEHLERLEHLEISNLSYELLPIKTPISETIIYLDPPYQNTGKYQNSIDYEILQKYIENSPYKIYVSSYEFELPCVLEIKHISTLSPTNNAKYIIEKIFCNKPENNFANQINLF